MKCPDCYLSERVHLGVWRCPLRPGLPLYSGDGCGRQELALLSPSEGSSTGVLTENSCFQQDAIERRNMNTQVLRCSSCGTERGLMGAAQALLYIEENGWEALPGNMQSCPLCVEKQKAEDSRRYEAARKEHPYTEDPETKVENQSPSFECEHCGAKQGRYGSTLPSGWRLIEKGTGCLCLHCSSYRHLLDMYSAVASSEPEPAGPKEVSAQDIDAPIGTLWRHSRGALEMYVSGVKGERARFVDAEGWPMDSCSSWFTGPLPQALIENNDRVARVVKGRKVEVGRAVYPSVSQHGVRRWYVDIGKNRHLWYPSDELFNFRPAEESE